MEDHMSRTGLSIAATLALLVAFSASLTVGASPFAAVAPGDPAFQRTWDRTDNPVATGQIVRTWMWGPEANTGPLLEQYEQSPGKRRVVQYFDKSRMEITDPFADQNTIWFVTNGLLVVELVTGELQLGDSQFEQYPPSMVNVAGDADDPRGPTYATFRKLMDVTAAIQLQAITQVIDRAGNITIDPSKASYAIPTVHFVSDTQHWVAEPFWDFMTASGIVYQNGVYGNDLLFSNPYYATGFPISEPFWADIKLAGVQRDVLVQCFERRCLTYTPANAPAWRVEMGNVGQHYRHWRYVEIPALPSEPCPESDPGTYVWVADTLNDRVQKFTGDGSFVCELTHTGSPSVAIEGPWSVAVDKRNNDVWVHTDGWLHRFDHRGVWKLSIDGDDLVFEDMAVDGNGNVYGISAQDSMIYKYAPDGEFIVKWGSHGDNVGEFVLPSGIDIDSHGNIYVVDRVNTRVSMFGPNGAFLHMLGSSDILNFPDAVAVDSGGNIYVTDGSILVFDANGAQIGQWDMTSGWTASHDIAITAGGTVYALDRVNSSVNYFNTSGVLLGGWGAYGAEPGNFDGAEGIAVSTR
jgi:DNA-binding beta-propeller fold protein YncE